MLCLVSMIILLDGDIGTTGPIEILNKYKNNNVICKLINIKFD